MLDIFQSQRFQSSLKSMAARSGQMARYLKRDANNRRRDYATIDRLNFRLNRVIPIIPGIAPVTGGIFGAAVSGGFSGFPLFRGFSIPKPPTVPPQGPPPPPPLPETSEQTETSTETSEQTETGLVLTGPDGTPVRFPELQQLPPIPVPEKEEEGAGVLEPALVQALIKELEKELEDQGITLPETEIPTIIPTEEPIKTPERELPPPLRLLQGILDALKLNELARGTTRLTLGQDGSQEKIREILLLTLNDKEVANKIVQLFGLSTQLIPLIRFAYNAIPVGPSKYKTFFSTLRFIVNGVRQGKLSPSRRQEFETEILGYVSAIRTGSADVARQRLINDPMRGVIPKQRPFKGVPDSQRIQNARAIERQGAMRAQGVDRSSPAQTYQNIFGQTEFARKIQQALGDSFPKFKPTQGKNMFDPEFPLVEFNVKDLGTITPPNFPKFIDKIFTRPQSIPKRTVGGEPVQVTPKLKSGRIEDQLREAGGIPSKSEKGATFVLPKNLSGPEKQQLMDTMSGLRSSVPDTLIQPIIIIRGTAA